MDNRSQNSQDLFLNRVRKDKLQATIYLLNGVKIVGRVKRFDKFILIVEGKDRQEQMVFKHAVSTISPAPASKAMADKPAA